MKPAVAILAAGQGTRMKSRLPKVLHPICGKPMICHVVDRAQELNASAITVVVGVGGEEVRSALGPGLDYAEQTEQLGTAHAMVQARASLAGRSDTILVLYGDVPLVTADTLSNLVQRHQESDAVLTVLTAFVENPAAYGRVIRGESGSITGIVEEIAATPEQRSIQEINTGIYCFDDPWLWPRLDLIQPDPRSGEYYLPGLVELAVDEGRTIASAVAEDPDETMGINNRVHLASAEAYLRERIRNTLMLSGVTMLHPPSAFIDEGASIGQDTVIHPNTHVLGGTTVGEGCEIGPNTVLRDAVVSDRCSIAASFVEDSHIEEDSSVGPFAHLRAGTRAGRGTRVGNYAEIKNSQLGSGVMVNHFSFMGDTVVGENSNVGAGVVTCNFDGKEKHSVHIGAGALIGSGTMLVAPVRVGAGSEVGAGSVVTTDVPPKTLAFGVPARVRRELSPEDLPEPSEPEE